MPDALEVGRRSGGLSLGLCVLFTLLTLVWITLIILDTGSPDDWAGTTCFWTVIYVGLAVSATIAGLISLSTTRSRKYVVFVCLGLVWAPSIFAFFMKG